MTGFRYIGLSILLVMLAGIIAFDFGVLHWSWLTTLSLESMCNDPELREYVFSPLSCNAQIGIVGLDAQATFDSPERIHELNRPEDIVHIAD